MSKIEYLICDDCGEAKPDAIHTICPYAQDVENEILECILCDACAHERAMDI